MSKKLISMAAFAAAALLVVPSYAASVSTRFELRQATPPEIADGVPTGSLVIDYFITTDADILRIGDVDVRFPVYNNPLGSDSAPPNPAFVTVFPALGADSFITTPGETAVAGNSDQPFDTNSSFFDSSNDGPVTNFNFARLTSTFPTFFNFVVSVAGSTGPEVFQFALFYYPEPTTLALLMTSGLCVLGCRRRNC